MSDGEIHIDGDKMGPLDDLVLKHYLLWYAFTASLDIGSSIEYRALLRYLTARGLVLVAQ